MLFRSFLNFQRVWFILLISCAAGRSQSCYPTPSGAVAIYPAEGDATDLINGNNGSLNGGVTFDCGVVGQGFVFDGSGYVAIPASSALDVGAAGGGFTAEAWVKPYNNQSVVFEFDSGTGSDGLQMFVNYPSQGFLYANLKDTSGADHQVHGSGIITSNFQHIALTYDPNTGNCFFYLNGVPVVSTNLGYIVPQTSYNLYLGTRYIYGPNYTFNGELDEFSLYNRALASNEISGIYSAGIFGKCDGNTVAGPPQITTPPMDVSSVVGATVRLAVAVPGCQLSYQWYFTNSPISNAIFPILTLPSIKANQAGPYYVVVSNPAGFVTSSIANVSLDTACHAISPGLVSWWRAEGDANDAAGLNSGTLQNGLAFAAGEVGQGYNFADTNGYVAVPASSSLDVGTNAGLTMDCWISPTDVTNQHTLWEWSDGANVGVQFATSVPGAGGVGSLYVNLVDTSRNSHVMQTATNVIKTNSFQHVAVTYDKASGVGKIFYNGNVVTQVTLGTFTPLTSLPLNFGRQITANPVASYRGIMDELDLYSRALPAADIQTIFLNGAQGKACNAPQIVSQPQSQTVTVGNGTNFSVSATGGLPLSYQWYANGLAIANATNNILAVTTTQTSGVGNHSVAISNTLGSVTSSIASLGVVSTVVTVNGQKASNNPVTVPISGLISIQNLYTNGYVFYTLDGSTPTFQSAYYNGPFTITQSATLRLLDYSFDFSQSAYSTPLVISVQPAYVLTISNSPGGNITASPSATNYASGSAVSLTAVASNGWTFLQWLGDVSGQSPTNSVLMTRNKGVKALFGTALNTSVAGNGSLKLNPPGGFYPYGTTVQISAIPATNYCFALWGEAASGSRNPYLFAVTNTNQMIASLFVGLATNQAALTAVPLGHGQISVSPISNIFALGQIATLTATPDSGKMFTGWSGDASGAQNPLTVSMTRSKVIYANFNLNSNLNFKVGVNGLADGFEVDVNGELGTAYRLDTSTNLRSWSPLLAFTNNVGVFRYVDTTATNFNRRYYRAVITQ